MSETPRPNGRWTIKDVLDWTTGYFVDRGISTARLDAEVLLAHSLCAERLHLYLNLERPLSPAERTAYRGLVLRRAAREPVALITGVKEFWSIPFRVARGVLIPRPETEILVQAILEEPACRTSPNILEIGTGCGAVAVSILKERPSAHVLGTDLNPLALELTLRNAISAGVADRLSLLRADLFSAIRPCERFHVICSNPPYIPTAAINGLDPEVRLFEPHDALDGGAEGLDVLRGITEQAGAFLLHGGTLVMEIGDGQERDVRGIFMSVGGFGEVRFFRDLAGTPRVVQGRIQRPRP
jgi:release factor glutamine methyltransferase